MIDLKENTILFNDDYKNIIKKIPDKSIDAIITDAPYLIAKNNSNFHTMGKRAGTVAMRFGDWDTVEEQGSIEELLEPLFKECPRILKENANVLVFNCWQNLGRIADMMIDNHIIPKRNFTIAKTNPAPFNMNVMPVNDTEHCIFAVFNSKDKPTKWTFNNNKEMIKCLMMSKVQANDLHPTQKDPAIIIKLTELFSNKGDVILDPFMGSGTQGIACKYTGRKFIGIEKDETYFKRAKDRIEYGIEKVAKEIEQDEENKQPTLFDYINGIVE